MIDLPWHKSKTCGERAQEIELTAIQEKILRYLVSRCKKGERPSGIGEHLCPKAFKTPQGAAFMAGPHLYRLKMLGLIMGVVWMSMASNLLFGIALGWVWVDQRPVVTKGGA